MTRGAVRAAVLIAGLVGCGPGRLPSLDIETDSARVHVVRDADGAIDLVARAANVVLLVRVPPNGAAAFHVRVR